MKPKGLMRAKVASEPRLVGSVDVLEPEEDRGHPEGAAPGGHEVLLTELGRGVDVRRGRPDPPGLLGDRDESGEIPLTGLEHSVGALPRVVGGAVGRLPHALAVGGARKILVHAEESYDLYRQGKNSCHKNFHKGFVVEMARYKFNALHLHLVDDQA